MKHNVYLIGLCLLMGLWNCGGDNPMTPEPEPDLEPKVDHATGDLVIDLPNGAKMAFMQIEPGTFMMGTPESEPGQFLAEEPQHQVTLTKGFYMGKYEVTQWQWQQVMGSQPWRSSVDSSDANDPAFNITWLEAEKFIEKLNASSTTHIFRFPTEAEWEYACRAGTTTRWSFGDDEWQLADYAWYDQNSNMQQPHRVGLKLPNPWGLYDMHGNVVEYTSDWWGSYLPDAQVDPTGPTDPPLQPKFTDSPVQYRDYIRVVRGGSFEAPDRLARSATRGFRDQGFGYRSMGFRVVAEVKP